MTYQSKAELRAEINRLKAALHDAQEAKGDAERVLRGAGYELKPLIEGIGGIYLNIDAWDLNSEGRAAAKKAQAAESALASLGYEYTTDRHFPQSTTLDWYEARESRVAYIEARKASAELTRANTERDTLNLVIEALRLTEYGYVDPDSFASLFAYSPKQPQHERLLADLKTALDVRRNRKVKATEDATEAKVSRIADPGRTHYFPILDITTPGEAEPWYADKDPVGRTESVKAEPAPKKKAAKKK